MEIDTPVRRILEIKGDRVHSVHPEASVMDAIHLMNEKKIGAVVVIFEGRLVGMFTERDLLTRVADQGRDPRKTHVRDVMSSPVVVIRPDLTIEDAMQVITQKRCRHLPVVAEGRLLGLISIGDLMRWSVRERDVYIENLLDYINSRYPG